MAGPIAHLTVRISGQIAELQKDMKTATAAVQGVASETQKASSTIASIGAGLKSFAGAIGVAFSVQAVVGFVSHVIDAASKIKDLSTQLGISTSAVQGFKFAAEQSGSSLDAVGTAIQKMNQNLAGGDKSVVGALTQAGLRFEDIRRMRPEDAFLEITDAIQGIKDPMVQARVALELFGRGAAELLPGIKEGFRGAADGADKMSDDTIRALEEAGDAWSKLGNQATIVSGGLIASLLSIGETTSLVLEKGVPHAVDTAMLALTKMNEELARTVKASAAFAGGAGKAGQFTPTDSVDDILRISGEMAEASKKAGKAHTEAATAGNKHADAIRRLREELSGDGAIKAANEMIAALRGLPSVQFMAADKQERVNRVMVEATEAYRQQGREVPPLIRMILLASMDLANAIPVVNGLSTEFERLGQVVAVTASEAVKNVPAIAGIGAEFGRIGTTIDAEMMPPLNDATDGLRELSASLAQLAQIGGSAFGPILQGLSSIVSGLSAAQQANERFSGSVGIASAMFSKNATGAEKWASGLASAGAIANGATGAWAASANTGSKAVGALSGAMSGAQAGAMFGPWGMAIGAAAGAVVGFVHTLSSGRRAVKDFAASFDTAALGTGFDELREKLLVLGDEGERLWVKLTQGTKKGDKAGAQAVAAEISGALAAFDKAKADSPETAAGEYKTREELQKTADKAKAVYEFMRESGKYTAGVLQDAFEKSERAHQDAMGGTATASTKALDAIKALDSELSLLFKSIENEAPEEVMGVIETNTRARIAAVEKERNAAQLAIDQAGEAGVQVIKTLDEELARLDGTEVTFKVKWDVPGLPGQAPVPGVPSGVGGGGSNQPIVVENYFDGELLAESLVTTLKRNGVR